MLSQGWTWADPTCLIQVTFTPITDTAFCTGSTLALGSCTWTRLSEKSRVANTSLLITLLSPQLFLVRGYCFSQELSDGGAHGQCKGPRDAECLDAN